MSVSHNYLEKNKEYENEDEYNEDEEVAYYRSLEGSVNEIDENEIDPSCLHTSSLFSLLNNASASQNAGNPELDVTYPSTPSPSGDTSTENAQVDLSPATMDHAAADLKPEPSLPQEAPVTPDGLNAKPSDQAIPPPADDLTENVPNASLPATNDEENNEPATSPPVAATTQGEPVAVDPLIFEAACRYRALGLTENESLVLLQVIVDRVPSATGLERSKLTRFLQELYHKQPHIPPKTDSGLADYCKQRIPYPVVYCSDVKKFVYWEINQWVFDQDDHRLSIIVDKLISIIPQSVQDKERMAYETFVGRASTTPSVVRVLKRRLEQVTRGAFDDQPYLLGVKNGVIVLKTYTFRAHRPEDYLTKIANVHYEKEARCPLFEKFINEILCGDQKLIQFVQTFIGYCLIGKNPERYIFILLGNGRNGKSTLILVIQKLLGAYARSMPIKTLLKSGHTGTGDDLMSIVGYRFLVTSELEESDTLAAGKLKSMSGNDVVSARNLYDTYQDITIDGKIVISTNEKPQVNDKSHGIWDRLQIIPFQYRIEDHQVDSELVSRLLNESAGILNWALEGLKLYDSHKFQETDEMQVLKKNYRLESDPVRYFLDEHYEISTTNKLSTKSVLNHYNQWLKDYHSRCPLMKQKTFNNALKNIGVTYEHNPHSVFYLKLKDQDQTEDNLDVFED